MKNESMHKGEHDYAYYMETVKFIRDLVHGYVYLTPFELRLVDTMEFQRLKDIRQLTCQHVYPSARHTRFEHSLGVLELTRQAIKNLNRNGFVLDSDASKPILNEQLQFNAALAALLHDIGHCPFSHLGEEIFDKDDVWDELYYAIKQCPNLKRTSLRKRILSINKELNEIKKPKSKTVESKKNPPSLPGAKHEQMSCIVILEKLYDILDSVEKDQIPYNKDEGTVLKVDFELLIRSILGLPYEIKGRTLTDEELCENQKKNIVVSLISSSIFDMDKLDYIMRDSLFTGINVPTVDTHRLFKNMYLKSRQDYSIVFTHRAVPSLQNMVESRDQLYMYVYNHHAAIFSDFMYSYIFRRLDHNAKDFAKTACSLITAEDRELILGTVARKPGTKSKEPNLDDLFQSSLCDPFPQIAVVPKSYAFSPRAVINQNRSDSDMISIIHDVFYSASMYKADTYFLGKMLSLLEDIGIRYDEKTLRSREEYQKFFSQFRSKIQRTLGLISCYQKRTFLKPWWKTNFEFRDFIEHNFQDDSVREQICIQICDDDEFRSQLAKHVLYITEKIIDDKNANSELGLLEKLDDGDFFVIKRSPRFFDIAALNKLYIALKSSEILGAPKDAKAKEGDFYFKTLPNILPQRDYYAMYNRNSFYIFSKPISEDMKKEVTPRECSRHYHAIERIFTFVATKFVRDGSREFWRKFKAESKEEIQKREIESMENFYKCFRESMGISK